LSGCRRPIAPVAAVCVEYVLKVGGRDLAEAVECRSTRLSAEHLLERFADPGEGDLVVTLDAVGLDPEQDIDAVARPFGDAGGGTSALSQVDRQACRRA
jgi:hypothetical protein